MQDAKELSALRAAVERHHMYFEVMPEITISIRGERVRTGAVFRLWARHDKGARPLPGCAKCRALHDALSSVAHWVLSNARITSRCDVEPFDRKLYATADLASDEVGLSLVVRPSDVATVDAERSIAPCVKEIRRLLAVVGVYEGAWRRRPPDVHQAPAANREIPTSADASQDEPTPRRTANAAAPRPVKTAFVTM